MLTSTVMHLVPDEDYLLDPTVGRHAHALFLEWVRKVAPQVAGRLHSPAPQKPFTVSPLQGPMTPLPGPKGVKVRLQAGATYWMRFTTLGQEVFQPFIACFLHPEAGCQLRLQNALFTVTDLITTPSLETRWSGYTTWEELLEGTGSPALLQVRFYSPTTFRQGKRNAPTLIPSLILRSWWSKWNAFSPFPMPWSPEEVISLGETLLLRSSRISSKVMDFGDHKEIGFQGEVELDLSPLPEETRRWVSILARFAFYAGTGAKTTMGMGQTWAQGSSLGAKAPRR